VSLAPSSKYLLSGGAITIILELHPLLDGVTLYYNRCFSNTMNEINKRLRECKWEHLVLLPQVQWWIFIVVTF
jgi:hypothetical protein